MIFMQTITQTQTQTPTAPVTPKVPTTFTVVGPDRAAQALPIPRTRAEIRAIQAQRSQISDQLENVTSRRNDIAEELARTGSDAARTGLEQRIQLLDQRILSLETDLARTGQQLAAAPSELVAGTEIPSRPNDDGDFASGFMAGGSSGLGLALLIFLLPRRWEKPRSGQSTQGGNDSARRLERVETGMDAIAIEIERISEGQRFVTKLLSDSAAVGNNSQRLGQPVPVKSGDPAAQ